MKHDDKSRSELLSQTSLKDRQRKFNDQLRTMEAEALAHAAPRIGDHMPDGTIFAGISPDAKTPMYAMPADVRMTVSFTRADKYATGANALKRHGHQDWRVPTKAKLNVLFNNRAAIGGFDLSIPPNPSGRYWSSEPHIEWMAWGQRFSDGRQIHFYFSAPSSVRLVR